jgi:cobalt-zinc-cadmium efflux system membrane fusion protein
MNRKISLRYLLAVCGSLMVSLAIGCGQACNPAATADADDHDHGAHVCNGHRHDGWWCDEHGMPEEVCAQCNPKLAAEFQRRGDWCADHDRPDSQCFVCHPELQAKFAARYEAKLGKMPPEPTL